MIFVSVVEYCGMCTKHGYSEIQLNVVFDLETIFKTVQ